jgi:hypothetical protein
MRAWQVERRQRTRHLIELGGLIVKAGIVDLTGDDRAMIFGALLWIADKLQSDQGEYARNLWAAKGKQAFEMIEVGGISNDVVTGSSAGCAQPAAARFCGNFCGNFLRAKTRFGPLLPPFERDEQWRVRGEIS